jgi:hypothetical protein
VLGDGAWTLVLDSSGENVAGLTSTGARHVPSHALAVWRRAPDPA